MLLPSSSAWSGDYLSILGAVIACACWDGWQQTVVLTQASKEMVKYGEKLGEKLDMQSDIEGWSD